MKLLTSQQFDSAKLKSKLPFRISEAARLVLVHGIELDAAASIVGIQEQVQLDLVMAAIEEINKAHQK